MKKYTITFAYDIEAENGDEAIDEFLKRLENDSISYPDSDDFIAKEKEI